MLRSASFTLEQFVDDDSKTDCKAAFYAMDTMVMLVRGHAGKGQHIRHLLCASKILPRWATAVLEVTHAHIGDSEHSQSRLEETAVNFAHCLLVPPKVPQMSGAAPERTEKLDPYDSAGVRGWPEPCIGTMHGEFVYSHGIA
eukprot:SAG31_NODE_1543_length_7944_cov_8.711281_3_plen_142_part_00